MTPLLTARDRRVAFLIVVVGTLVQIPGLFWGPPDGKAINNALRILDGDIPYRDFWTMYAPGHFYLVAVLFKLFGVHVWVPGVARLVLVAIDGALLFVLVRRLGLPRTPSALVGAAFIATRWGFGPAISSYETVLIWLLPAVDRAVAFAQGRSARSLVTAGLLCGIGAWFKHDVSFYVMAAITIGLCTSWFIVAARPANWVSPLGVVARVGAGAAAGAFPVLAFVAIKAGADAWRDLIVFPATDFSVVRGEGYPPLLPSWPPIAEWLASPLDPVRIYSLGTSLSGWMQANVPQIVFVAGVIVLVSIRRTLAPAAVAAAMIALTVMPMFWASAHVQHNTNFTSLWIFSVVLGAVLWNWAASQTWITWSVIGLFAVQTAGMLIEPGLLVGRAAYEWPNHRTLDFPIVAGLRVAESRYRILQPIVSFIRENVPESEPIYSGLVRHDSIVVSNQNFYYLSGRRVASRYNEIHPGIVDREEVQREIIADLERLNVRCAVLWDFGWPKDYMDRTLARRRQRIPELGATVLDEYLAQHFDRVAQFGEYILVWRKGIPMPPAPPDPAATGGNP